MQYWSGTALDILCITLKNIDLDLGRFAVSQQVSRLSFGHVCKMLLTSARPAS